MKDKKKIIFINGVFDVLHVGHFNLFNLAHDWKIRHGGKGKAEIHVAIDSDEKVKKSEKSTT